MAMPDDPPEVPNPADRPYPGLRETGTPPITPEPQRQTRIRRNLAKTLLAAMCSVLLAIVLIRHFSHPHETAAQRQQREELEASARDPEAQPDALRKRLEQQHALAETRRNAQQPRASDPVASVTPLDGTGIPKGRPGDDPGPVPPGYHVPGGGSGGTPDADRLARQRQAELMENQSLVAYEDPGGATRDNGEGRDNQLDAIPNDLQSALSREGNTAPGGLQSQLSAIASGMTHISERSATAQRNANWLASRGNDQQDAPLMPVPADSPYMVMGGTAIQTVALQGANSDMPGTFRAMVDRDIYDSINGTCRLIPRGTRIIGVTSNDVAVGQERMLIAATRMIFPNGASLRLDGLSGADPNGEAGVTADVNNHFFRIFGSTFLIAGVAAWIGHNQAQPGGTTININGGTSDTLTSAAAQSLSQTTQTILQRNMNIQPTLRLEPGQRITMITRRDMKLPPNLVDGSCLQ
ncbi:TrbI/VirB10 family protein [Paraburkholderia sp. HD33-4]|uniref:TrbI/VirB10 family protein n=1 Tax=Paraburkholderia sp. HD33-4 TaxID=2883242 RepID=UPI001F45E89A|nr:TrbI/VirB10 family protein [Paraburkholderia sp. HD33-4]